MVPMMFLGGLWVLPRHRREVLRNSIRMYPTRRYQICTRTAGEDIQLISRNVVERGYVDLEILRDHLLGHMGKPICQLSGRMCVSALFMASRRQSSSH